MIQRNGSDRLGVMEHCPATEINDHIDFDRVRPDGITTGCTIVAFTNRFAGTNPAAAGIVIRIPPNDSCSTG
jgi:hypothetical protein